MKKVLVLTMALLTAFSLTAVAHADVIASPAAVAGVTILQYLPWILVGAVVGVTVYILQNSGKRRNEGLR